MTHYLSRRRQVRALAWFALASLVSLLVLVALYQAFSFTHDGSASFHSYLASVRDSPPPPPVPFHSCTTCKPVTDDSFFCQECVFDKPVAVLSKPLSTQTLSAHRYNFIEQYLSNHTLLVDCRSYLSWCHGLMYATMDTVLDGNSDPLFAPLSFLSALLFFLLCAVLSFYLFRAYTLYRYLKTEQARIELAERSDREAERDALNRQLATSAIHSAAAGSGLLIGPGDEDTGLRHRSSLGGPTF